ncbi:MAG TPA: sigma-70 family RNA polymerase sigma factor [Ktedonobacterales bacterium]
MSDLPISATWWLRVTQGEQGMTLEDKQMSHFEVLYQRFYPGILGLLRFLVGNQEVAEDLTGLVFEKAWKHFADVRTPEAAGPWLFRIAQNCAADYFRRTRPTVSLERLLSIEHPRAASLEEHTLAHEDQRLLLAQLQRLSEREREIIGLKFVARLTNREIASVLQVPEGTVGSLLYRTLRRLRAALDAAGGQDEP